MPAEPPVRWSTAMQTALYGPAGFFTRPDSGPGDHFRTSVHASPLFAGAILRLLDGVDAALGHPAQLDLVDVGAGRGELLTTLLALAPPALQARLRPVAVELAPRPATVDPRIHWTDTPPTAVTGLLLATEWLDNVPCDLAEVDAGGHNRYVNVDPFGTETLGDPLTAADQDWLTRWWPGVRRAEIGRQRDLAWAGAVTTVRAGLALAVDYGHLREHRPTDGTLTGFRQGRQVPPRPDGSTDITAHVAVDAAADAAGGPYGLVTQRAALHALGVNGSRPPLPLASTDPGGYLRALADAGTAAELTDPTGLGGHWWLAHPRDIPMPTALAAAMGGCPA